MSVSLSTFFADNLGLSLAAFALRSSSRPRSRSGSRLGMRLLSRESSFGSHARASSSDGVRAFCADLDLRRGCCGAKSLLPRAEALLTSVEQLREWDSTFSVLVSTLRSAPEESLV